MKNISVLVVILLVLFLMGGRLGYSQLAPAPQGAAPKTYDVNSDGKPDVIYHGDGKYVSKVEADTNYDGRPDVVVHIKDGKFESAEVDTDYDGKTDKKFNDAPSFNKWVNENKPGFNDKLNKTDWRIDLMDF
ncbi:MAG: hypothetical protein PHW54_07010 [Candidatus Omnitrophica bacterium]|nr:hypothetical protein [Candidatus Omnitrophota bacterium]